MIYIVEDDSAIRELEQYALQSNGYEAVGFESSEPFWQAVHTTPQGRGGAQLFQDGEAILAGLSRRHGPTSTASGRSFSTTPATASPSAARR